MADILVGQFDDFERAEVVTKQLAALAVRADDIQVFVLNAPGQHDQYPIGGDEDADAAARGGEHGAITGAALGSVAGLAVGALAIPLAGPIAAVAGLGIGAYTGSLAGAVANMGDHPDALHPPASSRPAGVRVAVNVRDTPDREVVLQTFERHNAKSVESARGQWQSGSWSDFDPVSEPHWIVPPAA